MSNPRNQKPPVTDLQRMLEIFGLAPETVEAAVKLRRQGTVTKRDTTSQVAQSKTGKERT